MHLTAKIKTILLAASPIVIISCASASKDVETMDVSLDLYRSQNCNSLAYELAQLNKRKNTIAAELDKKASNDQGTALGAAWFLPAAVALGGNKEKEQEYARIKGEYDAVVQVGAEKQCNLDTSPALRTASLSQGSTPVSAILPTQYYAQAEEEVDAKSYDRNLWSRALIEAEGDETKRKARYIELRANQLYYEKLSATASNPDLPPAAMELRTYIAGNTSSGKTRKGDTFHVYSNPDGKMYGTSINKFNKESQDSGTWEITRDSQYCRTWDKWRNGKRDCYQVYALEGNKFRMKAIGKSYENIFTIRVGDPEELGKEATPDDTSTQVDISGTYRSDIIGSGDWSLGRSPNIEVILKQNKSEISGTFSGTRSGEIEGILNGDTIKFKWFLTVGRTESGRGEWKLPNDGITWNGTWRSTRGSQGNWNLTKIE